MDIREVFALNLRKARNAKGLSQEALAHEADVDRTYVSALERLMSVSKLLESSESFGFKGGGLIRGGPPMWTLENRPKYKRDHLRYPSDLTDDEWAYIKPLIPPAKPGGGKRRTDMRASSRNRNRQTIRSRQRVRTVTQALDRRTNHRMAQSLSPSRQGLGKSQPQRPRVLETCLHPPHAAKAL